MKKRAWRFSLKYKISILLLLVTLIPLIVLGGIMIKMYSNGIEKRSHLHIEENMSNMMSRVQRVLATADFCTQYVSYKLNEIQSDDDGLQIEELLNRSIGAYDIVESILYVTEEGSVYATDTRLLELKLSDIKTSSYMKQLVSASQETILFDKTETYMDFEESVVTMGKKIQYITSGKVMGYLFVNVSESYLLQKFKNNVSAYLMFDKHGNTVVRNPEVNLPTQYDSYEEIYKNPELTEYRVNKDKYLVMREEVPSYGWNVICVTNLNKFNVSSDEIFRMILLAGILIACFMGMVITIAKFLITKPLLQLRKGAEEIANGNLDVQFDFHTRDEIGELGSIFNSMTYKIKDLLSVVESEGKKKREYELALLQEQIKPHFLYNTLDVVLVLIEMKREYEAAYVIKRLAAYYRNSLSSSEEIISIETEIQIIEDYLELQMIQYGEEFSYEIFVDERAKNEDIPRMTLQPLVENAIHHGLKYKEQKGKILVDVRVVDTKIIIKIMDNGIGIPSHQLEELRHITDNAEKHFGLYSVKHRLLLYYGNKANLRIDSVYEQGTCITIEIPREEKFD